MLKDFLELQHECTELGFALSDIVARLHDVVFKLDIPSQVGYYYILKILTIFSILSTTRWLIY